MLASISVAITLRVMGVLTQSVRSTLFCRSCRQPFIQFRKQRLEFVAE